MESERTESLAVPMVKEEIVKDDGRRLYYYTFPAETETQGETEARGEAARDV